MDRRSFLMGLGLAGLGTTGAPGIRGVGLALAQGGTDQSSEEHPWGNPVVDMHFHCRRTPEANLLHHLERAMHGRIIREEFSACVHAHVQHVGNRLSAIADLEGPGVVACAMTGRAGRVDTRKE